VRIEVEDNGSGMSEETRTKIFEPFFTTKAPGQGSGLGLSTVYGIVSQSGGSVDVRSDLGRGTTVVVEFPASEDEDGTAEEPVREAAGLRGSETILLVEDDAQVLEVARQVLERHGYQVIACDSSQEALEQCQAGFERVDVLVADVVMPHMNGIELGRRARLLLPNLRNIWVSGYAQDDLRGDRELDGIFLRKPFSSESLLHAVRRALEADPEGGDKPDGEPA
jgi:CheY-like chemotaxis protein